MNLIIYVVHTQYMHGTHVVHTYKVHTYIVSTQYTYSTHIVHTQYTLSTYNTQQTQCIHSTIEHKQCIHSKNNEFIHRNYEYTHSKYIVHTQYTFYTYSTYKVHIVDKKLIHSTHCTSEGTVQGRAGYKEQVRYNLKLTAELRVNYSFI